jgi:hypothetical protein
MPVGVIAAAGISKCKASKLRQEEEVAHSVVVVSFVALSFMISSKFNLVLGGLVGTRLEVWYINW